MMTTHKLPVRKIKRRLSEIWEIKEIEERFFYDSDLFEILDVIPLREIALPIATVDDSRRTNANFLHQTYFTAAD